MLRNLPVRHKVTAISVVTTTVVLVFASLLFVGLEINNYRRAIVQELTAIAQITSSNSTAAIVFDDRLAALETLAALRARPNIEAASLFKADGQIFARFVPGMSDGGDPVGVGNTAGATADRIAAALESEQPYDLQWNSRSIDLYGPIHFDNEVIGAIHLRSSLAQIYTTIATYLWWVLVIIAVAIATAWILAIRLQSQVTRPILSLLDTMGEVSRQRDYSLRARKYGDDELGTLIDGFNTMLAQTEAHEAELSTARREAESASRMKSEFLAHMSHELRTPLNAILGFSDFILSEPSGPLGHASYREYMRDIRDGGQHLLTVINDILDLSKIEAGGVTLNEAEIDIEALIGECAWMLRERANNAGIDLRVETQSVFPQLLGDAQLLKRGLINLLSNAIKFTPAGGRITVQASVGPDGDFCLAVADTGIGIAPEQIGHVLTPFGQAENVFNRKHDGTGLGLPLVKWFVEMHGGTLDLQSAVGEGTVVTMRLPGERVRIQPVPRVAKVAVAPPRTTDSAASDDEAAPAAAVALSA